MRTDRRFSWIAAGCLCLAATLGCQDEGIRKYQAPRSQGTRLSPVTYQVPPGWREAFDPGSMRLAAFTVEEAGQRAEVTITRFPGAAGGLLDNVNRWRGQVNLGPVTDEQLKPELREWTIAGTPSQYVELVGPAREGQSPQRILGLVIPRGEQTWFIKMMGPDALVAKNRDAFAAFAKSLNINDARKTEGG